MPVAYVGTVRHHHWVRPPVRFYVRLEAPAPGRMLAQYPRLRGCALPAASHKPGKELLQLRLPRARWPADAPARVAGGAVPALPALRVMPVPLIDPPHSGQSRVPAFLQSMPHFSHLHMGKRASQWEASVL